MLPLSYNLVKLLTCLIKNGKLDQKHTTILVIKAVGWDFFSFILVYISRKKS